MKLTIAGSEFNKDLIDHAKSALTETLSPVKKDSIVKAFLTRFVGANNEHELPSHFSSETNKNSLENGQTLTVITLKEIEDGATIGLWTRVCASDDAVTRCEKELFSEFFYRFDIQRMREHVLCHFDGMIEDLYLPSGCTSDSEWEAAEKKMETFISDFKTYNEEKVIEWLFEHADSNEIMEDFIESISDGMFGVTYDYTPLHI